MKSSFWGILSWAAEFWWWWYWCCDVTLYAVDWDYVVADAVGTDVVAPAPNTADFDET